jgi:hypothetical protein
LPSKVSPADESKAYIYIGPTLSNKRANHSYKRVAIYNLGFD